MAYQNKHDTTGQNSLDGANSEELFRVLAENRGYRVTDSTRLQQFSHIDFWLEKDNNKWSVEVKARKKVSRQSEDYDDSKVWIEWRNVAGKDGWLVDENGAQILVFEQENEFLIVERKKLLELAKTLVDFNVIVDKAKKALNVTFRRFKRKDLLSLIECAKVREIVSKIWLKTKNSESTLSKSIKLT